MSILIMIRASPRELIRPIAMPTVLRINPGKESGRFDDRLA
jgi:hypothetical protein